MTIFTIGHSTRTLGDFVALLQAHQITRLGDVRTIPRSRRHPHFSAEALSLSLPQTGVEYRHFPGLGGLRKPRRDSRNGAWRHEGFRGYADYMQTGAFEEALNDLLTWADESGCTAAVGVVADREGARTSARGALRVVIMCAEAVWWRCHRQLIADALVAHGIEVRHITSTSAPEAHHLTQFARTDGTHVWYPSLVSGS
jgi:uncharacterized protein (DUF488 family)